MANPLARKQIFVQTPFSRSILKCGWKNFMSQNHVLFRCDQNLDFNLTSKFMKICEQIFKKRAPQYNSNSLDCEKNYEHNNSCLELLIGGALTYLSWGEL